MHVGMQGREYVSMCVCVVGGVQGKRVMSVDLGLLLAGAKERGELETRVTGLVSETISAGKRWGG